MSPSVALGEWHPWLPGLHLGLMIHFQPLLCAGTQEQCSAAKPATGCVPLAGPAGGLGWGPQGGGVDAAEEQLMWLQLAPPPPPRLGNKHPFLQKNRKGEATGVTATLST